jgi:hypothetical protein
MKSPLIKKKPKNLDQLTFNTQLINIEYLNITLILLRNKTQYNNKKRKKTEVLVFLLFQNFKCIIQ